MRFILADAVPSSGSPACRVWAVERTHDFGYNPAVEGRRLIDHGLPEELPGNLGGRFRFTPLSLYVGDQIAAVAFARLDTVGLSWIDVWLLSRRRGRWNLRTGGSAEARRCDELLAPRPVLKEHAVAGESGRFNTNAGRWLPHRERWVAYGIVRLSAEVEAVRISEQDIPVPGHGLQVLAWRLGPEHVSIDLLDHLGEPVSMLDLAPSSAA
jgi:hypothetical protein